MTARFVILLFALSTLCAGRARAQLGPGCGPADVKFDVKTAKGPHASPAPEPGKALVFFIQDDMKFEGGIRPTTRFGTDGTWLGATHANSYFYAFVDPGEHHVCANWQSVHFGSSFGVPKRSTAAAHLTAEAGKTYYFRAQDITKMDHTGGEHDTEVVSRAEVVLEPLDADEAQVVINSFSFSSSHPQH